MAMLRRSGTQCPDRRADLVAALEAVASAPEDGVQAACEAVAVIRNARCTGAGDTNYCERCMAVQVGYYHWTVNNRGLLGDRYHVLDRITRVRGLTWGA